MLRREQEDPRPQRDDLKDPDHVIDGRVVGSLFVAVVQAVDASEENPQWKACDEERELPGRRN